MTREELIKAAEEYFIERYGHLDYQSPEVTVNALVNFHLHQTKKMIEEAEKSNPFLAVSEEDGTYIKAFMKALSDGYNAALNKLKDL